MQTAETTQPIDEQFHISPEAVNSDDVIHVLNHSNTFGLFDRWGNILPHGKRAQGIYHQGTRFLNKLVLSINGQKPLLLSSSIKDDNDILSVDLANPALKTCNTPENTIHICRNQFIAEGSYYEKLKLHHFGDSECSFVLTLSFNADFKDIFEIRGIKRELETKPVQTITPSDRKIVIDYTGLDDIHRKTILTFNTTTDLKLENNKINFSVNLNPNESLYIDYCANFVVDNEFEINPNYEEAKQAIKEEFEKSQMLFANIKTTNERFNHWLFRSKVDLLSLLATTPNGLYPYAGVPWYNTSFGRDGLITAIETLWLAPEISKNVLLFLAAKQATELIPEKDAEPGKILHEARSGEMANTGEVPFKEYYGTIDATPLFIMLAGMYYERTADIDLIKKIWPNIRLALNWIKEYGDLDGDGFVEYIHKAHNGLTNQGWKDSFDSIMDEYGELAEPPIALSEVQGYVYAAKQHAALMAKTMGEEELSAELVTEAADLKKKFNESFWNESLGNFVLALDGKKRPCNVSSSNPGHCLFTKIVDNDKAKKMADTLLSSNLFNGWGIRTLSATEKRYNPMSYHNGSIWPHDNALIAYGLSIYGLHSHALKIMEAIYDASLFISLQRVPELFCGFERRSGEGPTEYPVACSPQAWSVAVVFMLLQACFRVEINALKKTIVFNKPRLPEYLDFIYIDQLSLSGGYCNLQMKRLENDVGFYLLEKPEDWEFIIKK